MATVVKKADVAQKAREAWAAAQGWKPAIAGGYLGSSGISPNSAQYVDVAFYPDGGAICELKGSGGHYLAHVILTPQEVAAQ